MLTHSLDDLAAVETIAARAKTAGLLDRCAITALTATSDRELDQISRHRHLTSTERAHVASWSSPPTWHPGANHPGRGRYLLTDRRVLAICRSRKPMESASGPIATR